MAHFSESAKARILAASPEAAEWLNAKPGYRAPASQASGSRPPRRTTGRTANKFAGSCQACHGHVAAGQGILGDKDKISGRFVIFHADGTCPDKKATATIEQPKPKSDSKRRNRYAAPCAECGGWVEAEQGLLIGSKGAWKTQHDGPCPAATAPAEKAAPAAAKRGNYPNRYAAKCVDCGTWVEAGEGIRFKTGDTWNTAHHPDQCPETEATRPDGTGERIELTAAQVDALPLGYYTVELDNGDYRTFRLRIKPAGQRNEGKIEISYLGGPNNMSNYWLLGLVEDNAIVTNKKIHNQVMRDTLAILIGDPHAAQMGFARRSSHCYKCGQPLTTPESLNLGIGPDCLTKS